uniref:Uncharacterized protein n=1 Tax=Caenorhabditis japonica TaxID=281687 RepID=A0A8R1ERX2_CAEJA
MSNQEEANESASSAPPIFTAEQVALFKSQLIELCRPDLQAMARRTEEKAPELSQKGLQVQAELNIKILNKLKEALEDQDQAKMIAAVKETIEMIRMRNSDSSCLTKSRSSPNRRETGSHFGLGWWDDGDGFSADAGDDDPTGGRGQSKATLPSA